MVSFKIEGSQELQKSLRELGRKGVQAAIRGLKITALEILNNAKERLQQGGQRVTSKLFNSGKVVQSEDKSECEVVFGDMGKEVSYAYYVEFGRRAGQYPPIDYIRAWVVKKGLADTYNIKTRKRIARGRDGYNIKTHKMNDYWTRATNIAYAIKNSIAKKGTKAHPFLFPAFEEKKGNAIKNIETEISKEISKLTK